MIVWRESMREREGVRGGKREYEEETEGGREGERVLHSMKIDCPTKV